MKFKAIFITCMALLVLIVLVLLRQASTTTEHLFDRFCRLKSERLGYIFLMCLNRDQLLAFARQACEFSGRPECKDHDPWGTANLWTGTCCDRLIQKCGDRALIEMLVSVVKDAKENGMFRTQALWVLERGSAEPRHELWRQLSPGQLKELKAVCYKGLADKSETLVFRVEAAYCIGNLFLWREGGQRGDEQEKAVEALTAVLKDKAESERVRLAMLRGLMSCMDRNPTDALRNKVKAQLVMLIQDPDTPVSVFFGACHLINYFYDDVSDMAKPPIVALIQSRIALSPKAQDAMFAIELLGKLKEAMAKAAKEERPER